MQSSETEAGEIKDQNRMTKSKEIETVLVSLPPKKVTEQMFTLVNSDKLLPNFLKHLQKTGREYIQTPFIRPALPDPKPDKNTTEEGNCRPSSMMNIDAKNPQQKSLQKRFSCL